MTRRIGILGGTFDPVHNGHLALADAAGELCALDTVLLLPAPVPPHKQEQTVSAFSHRAAMLEIAVQGRPSLQLSTIEQSLPSPSFTITTLNYLKSDAASSVVDFFFITGADTFLDIFSWKDYKKVLQATNFIVFLRHGSNEERLQDLLHELHYREKEHGWYSEVWKTWIHCSTRSLPAVSSSELRHLVSLGHSISHLTPQGVADYIAANGLYCR